MYAPAMIADKCTYELGTGSDTDISVDENGVVSVSTAATAGDSGTVVVSYVSGETSYSDTIIVNVVE